MIRHVNLRHWKLLTRNHIFLYIVAKRAQTIWREYNCIFACWVIAEVSSFLTRFLAISRPRAVLERLLNGLPYTVCHGERKFVSLSITKRCWSLAKTICYFSRAKHLPYFSWEANFTVYNAYLLMETEMQRAQKNVSKSVRYKFRLPFN